MFGGAHSQVEATSLQASAPSVSVVVPYGLPGAGEAVAIGSNTASQVRPSVISSTDWARSLFNSYGAGVFNPDFSAAGAYVTAGSGGHNSPPNQDAAVFDFSTESWKLISNTNGLAPRSADFTPAELSADNYREVLGASGSVPGASHLYAHTAYLPTSMGGGAKGSFVKIGSLATSTDAVYGRGLHKMDLATGKWTRLTGDVADFMWAYEGCTVFDPVDKRYYVIPDSFHNANYLQYYDIATATLKRTESYPYPTGYSANDYQAAIFDPVRRLILLQRPGWPLRALDLKNVGLGWVELKTSGTQPGGPNRWAFYEPDGRFYTRGNSSGQVLNRLTAPSDWKNGTWTYDTVSVTGAALPNFTATGGATRHYGTFFYVPSIKSLAWIAGESAKVVILRPPASASSSTAPASAP